MKISNLLLVIGAMVLVSAIFGAAIAVRTQIPGGSQKISSLSGVRSTVEHASLPLKHLEIIGPMRLILSAGMPSVIIEADEAIQGQLKDMDDDPETFRLEVPQYMRHLPLDIVARISSPDLESMELNGSIEVSSDGALSFRQNQFSCSGSTDLQLEYTDAAMIRIESSGSLSGELRGQTGTLDLEHSGSNSIEASELQADTVRLSFSGSTNSSVFAQDLLKVEGSGSGDIRYAGRPKIISDFSGSASLRSL